MFPRLFELGSFSLPTYGVLIALGFLVGISLSARLARRSGLDPERITNLGIVLLVSAILGAKLFLDRRQLYRTTPPISAGCSLSRRSAPGAFSMAGS